MTNHDDMPILGAVHSSPRDAPHHIAFFDELRRLMLLRIVCAHSARA